MERCTGNHCSKIREGVNDACKAAGWPIGHDVMVSLPNGTYCACTCSCMAYNVPIVTDSKGNTSPIQSINLGDTVLARQNNLWVEKDVGFSNGTNYDGFQPEMYYIKYEDSKHILHEIIVTFDHTFLTENNLLIRAQQLAKGMKIQLAEGEMTEITDYQVNNYAGGVWNISTTVETPDSLEGHLINTQGLISGDYTVQLFYDELVEKGFAVSQEDFPAFHSQSYHDRESGKNHQIDISPVVTISDYLKEINSTKNGSHKTTNNGSVYFYMNSGCALTMPFEVQGYLTKEQSERVKRTDFYSDSDIITYLTWIINVYHSYYDDIDFITDLSNPGANVFSFYENSQKTILIQGGIVYAKQIGWEGLVLVIAYSIARFFKNTPLLDNFSCKTHADYNAVKIMSHIFYPVYPEIMTPAFTQVKELFESISQTDVENSQEDNLVYRIKNYSCSMKYLPIPVQE